MAAQECNVQVPPVFPCGKEKLSLPDHPKRRGSLRINQLSCEDEWEGMPFLPYSCLWSPQSNQCLPQITLWSNKPCLTYFPYVSWSFCAYSIFQRGGISTCLNYTPRKYETREVGFLVDILLFCEPLDLTGSVIDWLVCFFSQASPHENMYIQWV